MEHNLVPWGGNKGSGISQFIGGSNSGGSVKFGIIGCGRVLGKDVLC